MAWFFQLISLYFANQSFIDCVIWSLGIVVIVWQLRVGYQLRGGGPRTAAAKQRLQLRYALLLRVASLAVDGLPMLGLLGTVGALLVTFAGIGGGPIRSNVIADFAPGLTTTISGLFWALANLVCLRLVLEPRGNAAFPELE